MQPTLYNRYTRLGRLLLTYVLYIYFLSFAKEADHNKSDRAHAKVHDATTTKRDIESAKRNERTGNMNNMDSLSFYDNDPAFASPLNNDESLCWVLGLEHIC